MATVSFAEFLRLEDGQDRRHELVGGRVWNMAGGSERHDLAAGLVYRLVAPGAEAHGCRPFAGNRLLRTVGDAAYYPDMMVVCGPAADRLFEQDPTLVVEVLWPSTEQVDRREKAAAYAGSGTLRQYVLVDPDRRRIEVATPGGDGLRWAAYGPGDVVPLLFGALPVDDFYDRVDATATT